MESRFPLVGRLWWLPAARFAGGRGVAGRWWRARAPSNEEGMDLGWLVENERGIFLDQGGSCWLVREGSRGTRWSGGAVGSMGQDP